MEVSTVKRKQAIPNNHNVLCGIRSVISKGMSEVQPLLNSWVFGTCFNFLSLISITQVCWPATYQSIYWEESLEQNSERNFLFPWEKFCLLHVFYQIVSWCKSVITTAKINFHLKLSFIHLLTNGRIIS